MFGVRISFSMPTLKHKGAVRTTKESKSPRQLVPFLFFCLLYYIGGAIIMRVMDVCPHHMTNNGQEEIGQSGSLGWEYKLENLRELSQS